MSIAIVTCTGDRPECLAMLKKNIERDFSEMANVTWIVVDDGVNPIEDIIKNCKVPTSYIRRKKTEDEPVHTLPLNLIVADLASDVCGDNNLDVDVILFAEDDDYYRPGWFNRCIIRIESGLDLYGEGRGLYYNILKPGMRDMCNFSLASLSATAMSKKAWDAMIVHCLTNRNNPGIDLWLWNKEKSGLTNTKLDIPVALKDCAVVQFKGMPGRKSPSTSHDPNNGYARDFDLKFLKAVIQPEDFQFYQDLVKG